MIKMNPGFKIEPQPPAPEPPPPPPPVQPTSIPVHNSQLATQELDQAKDTAQAKKNEAVIETTARRVQVAANLQQQTNHQPIVEDGGLEPVGIGGPPGSPPPEGELPELIPGNPANDPFVQSLEKAKSQEVSFGAPTSKDAARKAELSKGIERGSTDATRYSNQVTTWSEKSRMAHTIRYDGLGFRMLSKQELQDHPWIKRFDANERAARISFATAKNEFQLADRALKTGKLDEAEHHMKMGQELNRMGLEYDKANAEDLARRRERYFGKGGRVEASENTIKGYIMDTVGGEVVGRAASWALGKAVEKAWGALKKISPGEALALRKTLSDEKLLAKETPESLYRKSGGQILHDEGARLIQAARRAQEGLPIIPGNYQERLAHYAREAETYVSQAQSAFRRGDHAGARQLMDKAQDSYREASLLKGFVGETMGHVQVVARGGEIFQNMLPELRNMSNTDLVDHLQKQYAMSRKEAAAVASDIRRMPDHEFHFYGHDQLSPGSKFMADVADRMKYDAVAASKMTNQEFAELMAKDPKKALESLSVDAGKDFHAQVFAHHGPEYPTDWLEYGLDVNSAMRQERAYKKSVPWEKFGYQPHKGELYGITNPGDFDRASGWLKMGRGIIQDIEKESGVDFVQFPQKYVEGMY